MADITGAYCAETDIERWTQTAITASTTPSDSEAAVFAVARANILSSLCAGFGYTVTPTTVTAGSRLDYLLGEANAIGAALDYTVAQQFARSPSLSERAERLQILWFQYTGNQDENNPEIGYIEKEIHGNLASLSTDHILSGDTTARAVTAAPTEEPIGIGMGDRF